MLQTQTPNTGLFTVD